MEANHREGMRVGGPLPRWTPAQWARAEAVYEQVVAEENHSRARPQVTHTSVPRVRSHRTPSAAAPAASPANDDEPPGAHARPPSPRLVAFADAVADFIADLHLNGKLRDDEGPHD